MANEGVIITLKGQARTAHVYEDRVLLEHVLPGRDASGCSALIGGLTGIIVGGLLGDYIGAIMGGLVFAIMGAIAGTSTESKPTPVKSKVIPFESITAMELRDPSLGLGWIQFTIPGGIESLGGAIQATKDENTITFTTREQMLVAQKIQDYILAQKKAAKNTTTMPEIQTSQAHSSVADELVKLKSLLDQGILSQEEFATQKSKLLTS